MIIKLIKQTITGVGTDSLTGQSGVNISVQGCRLELDSLDKSAATPQPECSINFLSFCRPLSSGAE